MKIQLLLALSFCTALVAPPLAHAQQNPQLFGTQENAFFPLLSGEDTFLVVSNEETDGFQVWDVPARRSLWKSDDYFLAFSPDERTVMVAHGAAPVEHELSDLQGVRFDLLDARDGHLVRSMNTSLPENESEPLDYCFSLDGQEFRVATPHTLHIYNVQTGLLQSKKWAGLKGDDGLTCAAFASKKEQLVAFNGEIIILDATTAAQIRRLPFSQALKAPATPDSILEVSPDDFSFVENPYDEANSRVFRYSDGKLLWSASDWPTFSRDGKLAYVPTPTGLNVLDAHTGTKLKHLTGPKDYGFDLSLDGNTLYEARNGKIYKWPTRK